MSDPVELRGDIDADDIAVIDAVVQARPGANRMTIVREIISAWVAQKVHESTVVLNVRRGKGSGPPT